MQHFTKFMHIFVVYTLNNLIMKRTVAFIFAFCALAVSSVMAQDILVEEVHLQAPSDTVVLMEAPVQEFPAEELEVPKVDKQIFNHLAAGIPITMPLLPQGIGIIEVATTLTPIVQLRLGYTLPLSTFFSGVRWGGLTTTLEKFGVKGLPTSVDFNNQKINLSEAKLTLDSNLNGFNFFIDVFPGKKTPFHFTFGLYYNPFSSSNYLEGFAIDMSAPMKEAGFTPGRFNEVYFGFDENDPTFRISPDSNGVIRGGVMGCFKVGDSIFPLAVHPYAGIGFGRAVRPDRRVCVSFDMGVIYWGSPTLVVYDYSIDPSGTAVGFTPDRVSKSNDLRSMAEPLRITSLIPAYLLMKLNIFIRII